MPLSAETPREFGEELRRERELRDVSREHLAEAIRISIRQLDALESGRFEILPAKVFSRGFVRAIAIHLGLDADLYSAAFASVWDSWAETERSKTSKDLVQSGHHVRLSKPRRAASMSTLLVGGGIALTTALVTFGAVFLRSRGANAPERFPARSRIERATVPGSGPASLALPPSIASSTVALAPSPEPASSRAPGPEKAPSAAPQAVPNATPAAAPNAAPPQAGPLSPDRRPAPAAADVPAGPGVASMAPAPAARERFVLTMTFRDDCWTEVSADGRPVAAELVRKGTVKEFSSKARFVVTLGNAGAVTLSLNGAPVPLDRSSGKVVKNLVLDQSTALSRPTPG